MGSIDFRVQLASINHFGDEVGKALGDAIKLMVNHFVKKSRFMALEANDYKAIEDYSGVHET